MRKALATMVAVALFVGAGCAGTAELRPTRERLPSGIVIMSGMEARDESSWTIVGTAATPRIDSVWQSDARYDEIVAFYADTFKAQGFAVHTVENDEGMRIYWGQIKNVRLANDQSSDYVLVRKGKVDGKTVVHVVVKPKAP